MSDRFPLILMILVVVLCAYAMVAIGWVYVSDQISFDCAVSNQGKEIAIDFQKDSNNYWNGMVVLMIGFLWVKLLPTIKTPESNGGARKQLRNLNWTVFILANLFLLLSIIAIYLWSDRIVSAFWYASDKSEGQLMVPDISRPFFTNLVMAHRLFFIGGIAATALSVWTRHVRNR